MRTKFALSILIFAIILIAAFEIKSQCSCAYVTPDSSYVDVVFVGKIIDISNAKNGNKLNIQISETFKGISELKIVEITRDRSCGAAMTENKEYLFMASRDKESGEIWMSGCAYSHENMYQQQQMIEILRWKKNTQNQGGIIVGKVSGNLRNNEDSKKSAELDKVFLENSLGEKNEAKIEADGLYKFTNLTEGTYKVYIQLPETLTTYGDANGFDWMSSIRPNIKISGNEGRIQDFSILTNGIISGQIVNENGLAVTSIDVNLYRVDDKGEESLDGIEETNSQGNYRFKGLIPGNYYIKVGTKDWYLDPTEKNAEFPLTYFPNVLNKKNAGIIKLEQSQILKNKNIFLTSLKKRTLKGQVVMEDGTLVENAGIEIDVKRENDGQKLRGGNIVVTKTNANGEFSIKLYENTDYLISADVTERVSDVQVKVLFSSKCYVIPPNGNLKPLKIVLKKGSENCDEDKYGF